MTKRGIRPAPPPPDFSPSGGGVMSGRRPTLRRRAFLVPPFLILEALIAAAAFVLLSPAPGRAQSITVLLDNTGQTSSGTEDDVNDYDWAGQQFTTGSNLTGYTLGSVAVRGATAQATVPMTVTLRADSSGSPSSTDLATFTNPSSWIAGDNVFTLSSPVELEADTKYWVYMVATASIETRITQSVNLDSGSLDDWNIGYSCDSTACDGSLAFRYQIALRGTVVAPLLPTAVSNLGLTTDSTIALSNTAVRAQGFTTGSRDGGYTLYSILVDFDQKPSSPANLTVVLRSQDGDNPSLTGGITLSNPAYLGSPGTKTFTAPANTTLTKETTYYVSITDAASSNHGQVRTSSDDGEDSGALPGWSIGNEMHSFTIDGWDTSTDSILIAVRIARAPDAPTRFTAKEGNFQVSLSWGAPSFDGAAEVTMYRYRHKLSSASIWGSWTEVSGKTATVTGLTTGSAYDFEVQAKNTGGWGASASASATPRALADGVLVSGNNSPIGMWSPDGDTLWVGQWSSNQIYAYDLSDWDLVTSEQWTLTNPGAGSDNNLRPTGFYSDGTHIWVSDASVDRVFQYNFGDKSLTSNDYSLHSDNGKRQGLGSDGTTAWIADSDDDKLYAYKLSDFSRDGGKDIDLHDDNGEVRGLWSDGTIIWALDRDAERIFAYFLTDGSHNPGKDIWLPAEGVNYNGIWSDGTTMYVLENAFRAGVRTPRIHRLPMPSSVGNVRLPTSISRDVHLSDGQLSQPFTTGSNTGGYLLDRVTIMGGEFVYRRTPLAVTLRADDGSGNPSDVVLGEFYNLLGDRTHQHWEEGANVLPAVSPIPLLPDTTYHLHLWSDARVVVDVTSQTGDLDRGSSPGWSLAVVRNRVNGVWTPYSVFALKVALSFTNLVPADPQPVTDLRATGSADGSVRLDWTAPAPSAGISSYQYQVLKWGARNQSIPWHGRKWHDMSGSGPSTVSHTVTGLESGRRYAFRVRAVDADGTAGDPSNAARDWTEAPLAAPGAGAVGGPGRDTVVTLRWAGPEQLSRGYYPRMKAVAAGHEYRMKEGNGSYGPWIRLLPPQGAEGQITYKGNKRIVEYRAPDHGQGGEREFRNLTNGTEYTFQVRARMGGRVSPASAETTASPRAKDAPVRIKNLTATSRNGRVTFTWTEPPTNNPPHNYSWFWYEPVYDRVYESEPYYARLATLVIRHVIPFSWGETSGYRHMWQPLGGYRTDRVIAVHSDGSVTRSYTTPNIIDTTGYPAGETRNFGLRANFREDLSFSNQVTLQVDAGVQTGTRTLVSNRNVSTGNLPYVLSSTNNPMAQPFETGPNPSGYELRSVTLTPTAATLPSDLVVTIRESVPVTGRVTNIVVATLTNPSSFTQGVAAVFLAPDGTVLDPSTKYFVHIDGVGLSLTSTAFNLGDREDSGKADGWEMNVFVSFQSGTGQWINSDSGSALQIAIDGKIRIITYQGTPVSERDRLGNAAMNIPQFVEPGTGTQVLRHVIPGQNPGTKVGAPIKSVIPKGGSVTYSLKGSDSGSFSIDEDSGQIMTGPGESYDRGVKSTYSVQVKADGDEGGSAEAQVTIEVVDTGGAPAPPDIFAVISSSETEIELGWTEPSGEPTGYQVEWSTDGETGWTAVDPPHAGTVPSYAHAGLKPGTAYHYRVRGVNESGPGLWSEVLAATTDGVRINTPATGAPVIAGAAHVGGTLIADTSGIADADGLTNVSYTYRWQADGADIQDATDSAYIPVEADEGKAISVTVSFTDDAGFEETMTGAPTEAVTARPNRPATGLPAVTGVARVSQTLTADISGIADADGLTNASFAYQWRAGRADIADATGDTYTLTDAQQGKAVSVTVSFTDDRGHAEQLTSAATEAVAENDDYTMDDIFDGGSFGYLSVGESLTGVVEETGDVDFFTVDLKEGKTYRFEVTGSGNNPLENSRLSGVYLYLQEFACSGAYDDPPVLAYAMVAGRSETHVAAVRADDDGVGQYTITVAETSETNTGCDTLQPGQAEPVNTPATGLPTISGTAQVGETLLAYTSGISDDDGLTNATFAYQWQADGADIAGATGSSYTLVDADAGKAVSVTVSFTDDAGNAESLTSAATTAVAAKANTPATGLPTISGTAQVAETLSVDTSGIADADGLDNAVFSYQWVANDGSSDADIAGATDSTYTLTFAEAEKTIKVRVSFTDDRGNAESLTSAATDAVSATSQQQANSPATGQPAISGTAQVAETLSVDTSGIADDDGLDNARFSYQWQGDGADIVDATDSTYTLVDADAGKAISVTVIFTDDAGNAESLTSAATAAVAAKANIPATGLPTISGTAQVGETLSVDTSGIADEDGLADVTFAYQWQADGSDIAGATASSYTLVDADEGKALTVTVSFTDDAGNEESLTSTATNAVAAKPNTPATGAPSISGTAQVGETLVAYTSDISDDDGLTNATFAYQWQADGSDIAGATNAAYTLVDADEGRAISVQVSFTDDAGNAESLASAATDAVAGPPPEPLTASFSNGPPSHDGENTFTFELHFSEEFSVSYKRLRDQAFIASGGDVTRAKRLERGSNIVWRIHVRPDGDGAVSIILPVTTDCDDDGAICAGDGRMLSNRSELTVGGP